MTLFAYVGGYSAPDRNGRADGINVYRIDAPGGDWVHVQQVPSFDNPSFLRLAPGGRTLLAAHGGREAVSAFSVDPDSGTLAFLNRQDSGGRNPVDLGFAADGSAAAVAHYSSGTIGVLPLAPDGTLGPLRQSITLSGTTGPLKDAQPGPLPHGVTQDPNGRFLVIPDKGLDRIFVYAFEGGTLVPAPQPSTATRPGSGPRHAAFHPRLPRLYVLGELDSCVEVFEWNSKTGTLRSLQSVSALPPGTASQSFAAEIAVAHHGACVYTSNRGHDSIARFAVDPETGLLSLVETTPTQGHEPRLFALDPWGHLHVANQTSDTIVSFACDPADGALRNGRVTVRTGTPTAICFRE